MTVELSKTERRRAAKAKKKMAANMEKQKRQEKREEMKQRRRDQKMKPKQGFNENGCWICGASDHRKQDCTQCPLSEKGIYPKGGCCKVCQSKMHLAKDCPHKDGPQNTKKVFEDDDDIDDSLRGTAPNLLGGDALDNDRDFIEDNEDEDSKPVAVAKVARTKKVVKF
ncbi:hypothetical protein DYB32_001806 [Aphanomyces invadans]|uniref:CCHC-type domain-containing protein n=1 Tax=Aphanomyces invadans TaxID=157072 RepID=A0A3R6YDW1_9STRA|nr:hypothetical protein DYB32_001806 [Aphanomyces invadans]